MTVVGDLGRLAIFGGNDIVGVVSYGYASHHFQIRRIGDGKSVILFGKSQKSHFGVALSADQTRQNIAGSRIAKLKRVLIPSPSQFILRAVTAS